jgi:hypothetical protein
MSADNGVFVLQTHGPEFRVAYAQNIDSIYGKFNDDTGHWNGNMEAMRSLFEDAHLFKDIESALDKAQEISQDYEYLEYGICIVSDFKDLVYTQE